MSNPIDELFKRAFPKKDFPYSDSYWDKLQADLPPASSGSGIGSGMGSNIGSGISTWAISAAASVVGVGVGVIATTMYFNPPSADQQTDLLKETKVEVLDKKATFTDVEKKSSETASFVEISNIEESQELSTPTKVDSKIQTESFSEIKGSTSNKGSESTLEQSIASLEESPIHENSNSPKTSLIASNTALNSIIPKKDVLNSSDVQKATFKPVSNELHVSKNFTKENDQDAVVHMPILALQTEDHTIEMAPKEIETEFGEKITSHSSITYFGEVMAGYQYVDYDGFKGLNNVENIQDVLLKITSHYEVEAGVNFGAEWNGLQLYTGIHLNSLQQSYSLQYTETSENIIEHISQNTYLDKVDSSFVGHEIGIVKKDGKEYLDVVNSIYSVDSIYRTENDTTHTVETLSEEKRESASYRLEYAYIPVMVGYKVQFKKLFVQVHTGFTMGVLTNFSGNLFDEETGKTVEMLNGDQLNKTTWKYNLSAGIGYQINPRVSISVNPTISHSLNGPFKTSSNHAYNYTGYGLSTALRYNF